MRFYLLLIILFIPTAAAMNNIFDIMDEKYITHISELPKSTPKPETNWQPSLEWVYEHCRRDRGPYFIYGFLDIVGFERMAKINGKYYLNEPPLEAVVIRYETHACALGYGRYEGGWDYKLETYQNNNQFVAKLTATAILYYYIESNKYYDNITRVFYDYEPAPLQFNRTVNAKVNITEYNNSVNPRTEIQLMGDPYFVKYNYNSDEIINYKVTAHAEKTEKGISFANVTPANIWTKGTGSLRQMNDKVIIKGTSNPNYNNLTIRASNLYTTNISEPEISISRDTYSFNRSFSGLYISIIMISSIMLGTLYYTAKRSL